MSTFELIYHQQATTEIQLALQRFEEMLDAENQTLYS